MKTKIALLLFLLGCSFVLNAQISVASFELLDNDITAITHGTEVKDQNGNTCALIKVETTQKGFDFDFGIMVPMKVEQHVGEIWVYVPYGVKRVTIHHQILGTLRDYSFPMSIEKGKTYLMKLTTGKVRILLDEEATEQWLVFEITPKDAILEVDDKMWPVSAEGTSRSMMPFGTYTYRVQAQNYHPEVGRVEVNDPENNTVVTVTLQPNFGWIEVPADNGLRGAAVYIDNALIGKAPCKSDALKSGSHNVRILKEMYEPYTAAVTVSDNQTTHVAPTLTSDFARVTLQVDADAEIWVNDEKKGVRSWTGDLPTGTYRIECKQQGHESTSTQKKVSNSMNGEVITLQAPIPIYGSLNVECTPDLATIYVDGKEMGKAPKLIGKVLVGTHELRLSKSGYADYMETVTITQGQRTQVTATLSNGKEIQFTCNVPNAQLEIDGQRMASANGTYMLSYGQHNLRATATDYQDYTYTLNVSESGSRSHGIQMKALVKDEETFTVNGVSFTMKLVEGGTFSMGATSEQGGDAESDEKPVHSVTVSTFMMGETEVTQALWKAVMGTEPTYNGGWENQYGKGNDYPAYRVSWNDIKDFIRKLNQKTGKNFRLPTEAEWEYAARGGKKSMGYKYAGSNTIGDVAWYKDNGGNKTHEVKGKSPNELGLYDMAGNVWEWCSDRYGSDYYENFPSTNPLGPSSGTARVMRGGSRINVEGSCRVSNRYESSPDYRDNRGLRLCLPQ